MLDRFDPVPDYERGAWRQHKERPGTSREFYVGGGNRYRFFAKPLSKASEDEEPLKLTEDESYWLLLKEAEGPTCVSTGTQTDYRENETQTDPWDPPYKVKEKSKEPEVLMVAELRYGEGLPITGVEVKEIIRAREKRQWEATLPPISSDKMLQQRRHEMVVEERIKEMNYTKMKIREMQEKKLVLKESALMEEFEERCKQKERLLEQRWVTKKAELATKASKLREKFARSMQKFDRKHALLARKNDPHVMHPDDNSLKDIFSDTAAVRNRAREQGDTPLTQFYLENAKGLAELERWLWEEQRIVMEPEIYLPKREPRPTRVQKIIEQQMQKEYSATERKAEKVVAGLMGKTAVSERSRLRPPTPTIPSVSEAQHKCDTAAVVLQKTIRGRTLQKEVLEICNKYVDVIGELQKTYAITVERRETLNKKQNEMFLHYLDIRDNEFQACEREEILNRFEGKAISEKLNVMGRTCEWYDQYLQIMEIVAIAKEERRRREAVEAGRRQRETLQKAVLNEFLKQVNVERETVITDFMDTFMATED